MPTKKLKVKTKAGKIVEYPVSKVKRILSDAGYSGKVLVKATSEVFKEAKKLTKGGVITATNLQKAIVKSVAKTNNTIINSAQKIVKRVLK